MCPTCQDIILRKDFYSPRDYFNCLSYIRELIDSGAFEMESATCDVDKVKDERGKWVDDIIAHVIRCRSCGQAFTCSVCTYRGGGGFRRER